MMFWDSGWAWWEAGLMWLAMIAFWVLLVWLFDAGPGQHATAAVGAPGAGAQ